MKRILIITKEVTKALLVASFYAIAIVAIFAAFPVACGVAAGLLARSYHWAAGGDRALEETESP